MRVQVIRAHPLDDSFTAAVARTAVQSLRANGHELVDTDLYGIDFDPRLSAIERRGYFDEPNDTSQVDTLVRHLLRAQLLVLCFPHWWFGMPAVMKGYFDRVWAPGVAFRHDRAGGRIEPLLTELRHVVVLTSFGAPWWLVELGMRSPVRRTLRTGIIGACAPAATFRWLALHDMDRSTAVRRDSFLDRVRGELNRY